MIDEHSREDELIVQIIGLQGKIERLEKEKQDRIADFLTDINIIDNLYGKESITIFNIREKWEKNKNE